MEGFHVATLLSTALVIIYSDHQGFLYFTGKKQLLQKSFLRFSHRAVWAGLVLMIISGVVMVIPKWAHLLQEPVFFVKMGFVLVLIVNGVAIGKLSKVAAERPFASLTKEEKRTLLLSGALSATGWVGAALIGAFFL